MTANPATSASQKGALAALSLSVLLPSMGISIANVALPEMARAFDASFQEIQLVVLAYLVANTVFTVFAGRLGDIAGRGRVLVNGIWLFAAASAACGLAPGLWMLDAARVAQGMGAAIMLALAMALVSDTVAKERTGSAMGLLGTMSAIGTALGPSLGGVLTAMLGWRAVFIVSASVALVVGFLAREYVPREPPSGTPAPWGFAGLANEPRLAGALGMSALVSTVMMTTLIVGPFHLSRTLGLDAARAGLVMSVGPAVAALAGWPAGRMVDRLGASLMAIAGLGGMVAGCVALAWAPVSWGAWGYVFPLAMLTGHYALFQAANNTAVMKDVARDRRGVVSGTLSLARNVGFILGASAMGAVFAAADVGVTFMGAAGLIALALAIALPGAIPARRRLA